MTIPDSDLQSLQDWYNAGLYVTAWKHAQTLPPMREWRAPASCTLAGRLLGNLEANRLAHVLHCRAWRTDRSSPEAAYFRAYSVYHRLGPLRALRFLEKLPAFPHASVEVRSATLALHSSILARFRDVSRCERLWEEALALDSKQAWIWVERSSALEALDAYPEALAAAQRALELRPMYRPAVQSTAHLLGLAGRDEEAFTLLRSAVETLESPAVAAQLAALLSEHERHDEALIEWKRYRELAVAIEAGSLEWWHARMSDTLYELGRIAEAGEHARLAKNGFHEQIADRLLSPPAEARVVRLNVPFVRQHNMTCAPATLSALSRYWEMPVDHLALAREICYDGTQSHRERHWASEHGYVAREFTVTWDAATALLNQGIPFAVATVETRSAHLQAVMGYDGVRGTLILRDPYLKHPGEAIGAKWLETYRPVGPRGFVMVPQGRADLLAGIELPDAALYDQLHIIERSVFLHDRPRAEAALAALEGAAPGHRIALEGRRELAWYDQNQAAILAAIEGLLALYPEHNGLRWARYQALEDLSRHADRKALLEEMARDKKAEPAFWREYARNLQLDARRLPDARRWLLRTLRYSPTDAENLYAMAGVLWDERRLNDAYALYRLAASLRGKVEFLQRAYFQAARHLRRTEEVISALEARVSNEGQVSSFPARTLFVALTSLARDHEALAVLDAAIAKHPTDGDLLCFAADAFARYAQPDRAQALLAAADGHCPRNLWLQTAATLAEYRADSQEALRLRQRALADAPLDLQLQETVTRLLAETQGRSVALTHLRAQLARFPHHLGLRRVYVSWLRGEGAATCEAPIREILAMAPENVWALRELALVLTELNRTDEAIALCDQAVAITPKDECSHGIRSHALFAAGRRPEAAAAARTAIELSVDYTAAYSTLLDCAESHSQKREALAFILRELEKQVVFGDGILQYLQLAFRILDPGELLTNLQDAHRARPDLWHAWSALITHMCDTQRAADALPIAREAVERFPLLPRIWCDLARVHRERREFQEEIEALQRAHGLAPAWGFLCRQLAEALTRVERYPEAERVLEDAIAASPLDTSVYANLAELLWRRGRNSRSIELLIQALRLDPEQAHLWENLRAILPPTDPRAIDLARQLTETRSGEVGPWLRLAEMLPASELSNRLQAIDRALALNPRNLEAHDLRAWFLSEAGRYEEALAACQPAVFGDNIPRELRARAAWILARRGNIAAAVEAMRAVTADHPDYIWAWERIAEWSDRLGDHASERDAAEKMSRLSPRSAVPLGYLAAALLKLQRPAEALKILERAFALDPSYDYAGFTIFAEYLRTKDFESAAATLAKLEQHLPGPHTTAASIQLAIARKETETALHIFPRLLTVPDAEAGALFTAAKALKEGQMAVEMEKAIWAAHADPAINSAAAVIWVRSFTERNRWDHHAKLAELTPGTRFAEAAYREFANVCGDHRKKSLLEEFIKDHRGWLANDTEGWGSVGYALVACGAQKEALAWLGDWKRYKDVQPWMLSNYARILEDAGREKEAMEVARHALELPRDHTSAVILTRLSALEALSEMTPATVTRLGELDYGQLQPRQRSEYAMVHAVAAVSAADPGNVKNVYKNKRALFYGEHPDVHEDPLLRALLPRFERVLARHAGVRPARPMRVKGGMTSRGMAREKPFALGEWLIPIVVALYFVFRLATCSQNSTPPPAVPSMKLPARD